MTITLRSMALAGCLAGALACSFHAGAQGSSTGADTKARSETASCDGGQQDRSACLREAGAVRQESQRGRLEATRPAETEQNAVARCQYQPVAERAACEARMQGMGQTSVEGSVMGGGVIRETVTPVAPGSR